MGLHLRFVSTFAGQLSAHWPMAPDRTNAYCSVRPGFRQRMAIDTLRDRLRYSKDTVSPAPRFLSNPLSYSRFVLNQLPDKLAGKPPHRCKFVDRVMPLGE